MAYARSGLDSDIYLYRSAEEGDWMCLGCELAVGAGECRMGTREDAIAHVREHLAAGHKTGRALERLEEELAQESNR